jgi:hypothetical protein
MPIHFAQFCFSTPVSPQGVQRPDTFTYDNRPGSMCLASEI